VKRTGGRSTIGSLRREGVKSPRFYSIKPVRGAGRKKKKKKLTLPTVEKRKKKKGGEKSSSLSKREGGDRLRPSNANMKKKGKEARGVLVGREPFGAAEKGKKSLLSFFVKKRKEEEKAVTNSLEK